MMDIKPKNRNTLTLVLFAVYLLVLAWLILFKLQFSVAVMEEGRIVNLIPLLGSFDKNGVIRFAEIRNNIFVFVPFGIYICMLKGEWPFAKKVLATAALTLVFETTQFIFAIGRADITDVLSNTLGGVIGVGIYAVLFKLMKGKTNKVLNVVAAVLTVLAVSFIALLLISNQWVRIK